jgi:hypothetical protein
MGAQYTSPADSITDKYMTCLRNEESKTNSSTADKKWNRGSVKLTTTSVWARQSKVMKMI